MINSSPVRLPRINEKYIRQNFIISSLESGSITKDELFKSAEENNIIFKPDTFKKDIQCLKKQGYQITCAHTGLITLQNPGIASPQITVQTITQLDLYIYLLIKESSLPELAQQSFLSEYYVRRNFIHLMKDFGLIIMDPSSRKYRITENTNNRIIALSSKNAEHRRLLLNYWIDSENLNNSYIKNIRPNIIRFLCENDSVLSYSTIKSNYNNLAKLPDYMKSLSALNYQSTPLQFIYQGKNGRHKISFFLTELIAYSPTKDLLYFIGQTKQIKHEYAIFTADKIEWSSISPSTNHDLFDLEVKRNPNFLEQTKQYYLDLQKEMFGVSDSTPCKIRLKIQFSDSNYKHFRYLNEIREKSQLKIYAKDGTLINGSSHKVRSYMEYSDVIRGIDEFSKFLRKFGNDITIIDGIKLKEKMFNTSSNVLKNYEVN